MSTEARLTAGRRRGPAGRPPAGADPRPGGPGLRARPDGRPPESFEPRQAFGAEKALLLRVRSLDPLELESLRAWASPIEQVAACVRGRSRGGRQRVAHPPRRGDRRAAARRELAVRGPPRRARRARCAGARTPCCARPSPTPGRARPWPSSTSRPRRGRGLLAARPALPAGYATALGHAFGLFLTGEQRRRRWRTTGAPAQRGPGERPRDHRRQRGDEPAARRAARELPAGHRGAHPRPILILGDTGTGKDLVARYLHYYSPLAQPRSVRGVQLRGPRRRPRADHAVRPRAGRVHGRHRRRARPLPRRPPGHVVPGRDRRDAGAGQELLLKVLDHWTVQPVGDTRSYAVDVQLVCATNRDLAAAVRRGRFRHDLLPAAEGPHHAPEPAGRAPRRRPPAAGLLPGPRRARPAQAHPRAGPRRAAGAARLRLAGQRAGGGRACARPSSPTPGPATRSRPADLRPALPRGAAGRRSAPGERCRHRPLGLLPRGPRDGSSGRSCWGGWSSTTGTSRRPPAAWASPRPRCTATCSATG